jgi:hypothetical protein
MSDSPSPEFVDRLEGEIRGALRRKQFAAAPARRSRTPVWLLALVCSGVLGASGVLFAQHVAGERVRELVTLKAEIHAKRAERSAMRASAQLIEIRTMYDNGVLGADELQEAELSAARSSSKLAQRKLDLEEVRLSGEEPRRGIDAPLIGRRDFVSESLALAKAGLKKDKEAADKRAKSLKARFDASVIDMTSLEAGRLEAALVTEKLALVTELVGLRRGFRAGEIDAGQAPLLELRVRALAALKRAKLLRDDSIGRLRRVKALYKNGVQSSTDVRRVESDRDRFEAAVELAEVELDLIAAQLEDE